MILISFIELRMNNTIFVKRSLPVLWFLKAIYGRNQPSSRPKSTNTIHNIIHFRVAMLNCKQVSINIIMEIVS